MGAVNVVGSSCIGAINGGSQLGPTSQCASRKTSTSPDKKDLHKHQSTFSTRSYAKKH